jgi:hypothetical protein
MATQSFTSTDLQTLLTYPFQGTDWKNKFLIGSLITIAGFVIPLIPIVILYGYTMQIMRHIIVEQGEPVLPEWNDWGKLLLDGLKLLGVVLVYMLPLMLLFFVGFAFLFLPLGLGAPLIGGIEEGGGETAGPILTLLIVITVLGAVVIFGLLTIISIALGVVMPAVIGHVVATDEFGAAFRVREWWSIFRTNLAGFLIAYAVIIGLSIALNIGFTVISFTVILVCLLPIIIGPITMYIMAIYGAVFGQAYRDGVQKLKSQAEVTST